MDSHIPTAAHTDVVACGNDVYDAFVRIFFDSFSGAVGGMVFRSVFYNEYVEFERCLLTQRTVDGIANGTYTVAYGYHYGCLVFEALFM